MSLPLDPARVRANFPAFSEPSLAGKAYFDNAGGSYTSQQVLERLDHYYRATKIQPYGSNSTSQTAGEAMDMGYSAMSKALNVPVNWVHVGPSTSINTYVLGKAFGEILSPGDVVIVTNQDHEANSGAWRKLEQFGLEIREWQVDPHTGHLGLEGLDNLLDDKVKLVAFPHCSNIIGEINPVAEICARAKSVGAISIVDGVAYAPHGLPDVAALGADFYLFSAYKTYGPHQGVMTVRPELLAELPNQGHFFNDAKLRYRLTPAGPDHAQIAALAGVAEYLETVAEIADGGANGATVYQQAHDAMRRQEEILMMPLLDWLKNSNRVRLIGPDTPQGRAPTIALALNEPGNDAAARLAGHNIIASGGHFYAYRLMQALKIAPDHGVLRVSFVHYTTPDEISTLISALDAELA